MYNQFTEIRENGGQDYSIYRITLAFRDTPLENQFQKSYFESNLQVGRACHLIAILFFGVVGMWNAFMVDPEGLGIWIGAISVVALVFLSGLASSYLATEAYARFWQPLFAFYVLITGSAFTFITIVSDTDLLTSNYAGIIFSLFFCYGFIRLTFVWASAAGNTIVMMYIVCTGLFIELPLGTVLTLSFNVFGINFLGMMICYSLELKSRRDFMLNQLLKQAEINAQNLNMRLEEMVAERTKALHQTNDELRISIQREKELVTKLENEEKRLQKSLQSIEQAETISKLGYFEINWQTRDGYASKGFRKHYGYENTPITQVYDDFIERIHNADKDRISAYIRKALAEHTPIDDEFRFIHDDGREIQIHGIADSFYDLDDTPLVTRGVLQDITERKQAEETLKTLEDQLFQAQKMESVGRLAGGVAHDYNNISGIIIGYADLAIGELNPDEPLYTYIDEILKAAQRAAGITRQLLAFARKQNVAPKVIDLNNTVEGMLKILRRLIGENISLAWIPGGATWPVKIDPTQVDQILANLCVNAKDAITNIGRVTIETKNVTIEEPYCASHVGCIPGDFCMLCVSDDGEGMSPDTLENAFEPFYTTKDIGQGTGLGLATVYGIVKQNDGFINIYSEPSFGTTIKIFLPRHRGKALVTLPEEPVEMPMGSGETVLLVEDDVSILRLSSIMLTGLGYVVLAVNSPNQALDLAKNQKDVIRLLITDVVMPEMNGRELATALQTISPGLKTLFMSGYTADVIAHHGVLEEGINFISKPFSKMDLAVKIKEILA